MHKSEKRIMAMSQKVAMQNTHPNDELKKRGVSKRAWLPPADLNKNPILIEAKCKKVEKQKRKMSRYWPSST